MKYSILFIAALLIYQSVTAQDYYQQTIDDTTRVDEQIFLTKTVAAPNGNFFVSGYERWPDGFDYNYRAIVMMIDSSGQMLWNKVFDKDSALIFKAIVPFAGGCYAMGYYDPILIKLDLEGNVTGSNIIYNSDSSLYMDDMVPYNGGILLSGNGGGSPEHVFLFKIDSAGNLTALGKYIFDEGIYVTGILGDGLDFYLFGWMWEYLVGQTKKTGFIHRFNGDGNLLWAKKFKMNGGFTLTFIRGAGINEDRTVNVVYDASNIFGSDTKIGLNRIDSNGNFLLEKEFATSPGLAPLVIAGMSLSKKKEITIYGGNSVVGNYDTMFVFRYDADFNPLWSKSFDHFSIPDPFSWTHTDGGIAETEGGNLVIAGYNSFSQKGAIRKITPEGAGCDVQDFFLQNFNQSLTIFDVTNYSSEVESYTLTPISLTVSSPLVSYFGCDTLVSAVTEPITSSIHLFPNPFHHTFKLTTNAYSEVTIYDMTGQLLESYKNVTGEFSGGEQLAPGIYFIEIRTSPGDHEMLKVVKME